MDNYNNTRGNNLLSIFIKYLNVHADIQLNRSYKILDFGCGKGDFTVAAYNYGLDIYGIDCNNEFESHTSLSNRFSSYDGSILPYEANTFDIVYSWYVLEHIMDINQSLREIVRVLKPNGICALFTQDARSAYDGHVGIPWPPFLHPKFFSAYIDSYGWEDVFNKYSGRSKEEILQYMKKNVFYVISDNICSMLKTLSMDILHCSNPTIYPSNAFIYIDSEDNAKKAAVMLRKMKDLGKWKRPQTEIAILARKR